MNNKLEKIAKLKEKIEALDKNKNNTSESKKESGAGFGFKISTELVAALIVGVGIGLIVDNYLETKPIFLIIFFILGAFAGFLNVYRVMRRIEKQ
jgi:ATP synthase protein I